MERKSGFDLKHGMHCIRLLRCGLEILREGKIIVNRQLAGDVDELKAILQGVYSYEQVVKMADDVVAQMDEAMQQSTLPQSPELQRINQLCIELVEMQGW